MLREELTARFRDFEAREPVHDWLWGRWRAWPVLRTQLALSLHQRPPASAPPARRRLTRAARRRWRGLRRLAAHTRERRRPDLPAACVFLTSGDRGQAFGGLRYNTVVDPWAEALRAAGERPCVWESGDPRGRTLPVHVSIQHRLDRALRGVTAAPGAPPPWWRALENFIGRELGAAFRWAELEAELCSVDAHAAVFARWLARAAPRAVVLDCWYLRDRMGATLAARRLGIPTLDLQHGIQGRGHPAYSGWRRRPREGYEVLPDAFCVWGDWDAEALVDGNPGAIARGDVRVVGNPWLAAWVAPRHSRYAEPIQAARRLAGSRHAVLVTLQKGVAYAETLAPLIRRCPTDWLWLVRLHRSMELCPRRVQRELEASTGRRIEVVLATQLPLYALMHACQHHVTGFSTCALEALAFGLPTLLTHESGAHAYAEFIRDGVMRVARTREDGSDWLAGRSSALSEACRAAARRVFAEPGTLL